MSSKGKDKISSSVSSNKMQRIVLPLASLNQYQANWTIKVFVADKQLMRTYKNVRGEGCLFSVELADADGTRIQATMFNEAAKKFFPKFELGKVYYISRGTLKVAKKQFATVDNDYEMTLNQYSHVEEAINETMLVPERNFSFVSIDQLGRYVNTMELVDVIGVVQHVSPTIRVKRKSNNDIIPKRDITIADDTKKTVVVTLWNDQATYMGQEVFDMADKSPVLAIKSLRVGDFQGVSLSPLPNSYIRINPDIPEAHKLHSWYNSEGKQSAVASTASCLPPSMKRDGTAIYSDQVTIDHITSNPSLGDNQPVFFTTRAWMSCIRPYRTISYRACKTCMKKVTVGAGSGYWCQRCEKEEEEYNLRYILSAQFSDASGSAWFSMFNDEAEKLIGYSADELDKIKSQEEGTNFKLQLRKATWVPYVFRISVASSEYNNKKHQRITVREILPVNFAAETRFFLQEIAMMKE